MRTGIGFICEHERSAGKRGGLEVANRAEPEVASCAGGREIDLKLKILRQNFSCQACSPEAHVKLDVWDCR